MFVAMKHFTPHSTVLYRVTLREYENVGGRGGAGKMNRWEGENRELYGAKKKTKEKKNRIEENIGRNHRFGKVRIFCVRWNEIK